MKDFSLSYCYVTLELLIVQFFPKISSLAESKLTLRFSSVVILLA
jgi:hypothetical protein